MSRDQKLQTSVSNFKKNFQLGLISYWVMRSLGQSHTWPIVAQTNMVNHNQTR